MSLAAIRATMRTAVDGMSGVDACYPRIPETKPTVTTFAVVETPSGEVAPYGTDIERREYLINVYFFVKRAGDLWAEQVAIEPFIDSFPDTMHGVFQMCVATYGTRYAEPAWEMVEAQIDDQAYIGIKYGTLHKVKTTVTYSG